ncbi:MAG: CpsD/CapB family tyrosine-protein kinase [Pseudorhodobacter sp.]
MANHDILMVSAENPADLEQGEMDEQSFRRMAEERKRARPAGPSLFRQGRTIAGNPVAAALDAPSAHPSAPLDLAPPRPERVWESVNPMVPDEALLARNGLFTNPAQNPATAYFDLLRTRILQPMQDRGWRRIVVTSPTHGCGKSLVAANLALSLARRPNSRTLLLDLELRAPRLARMFGLGDAGALREVLAGEQPFECHLRRIGRTLALGFNAAPVPDAAELLHDPVTADSLAAMMEGLDPQVALFDTPPALVSDDVLALAPFVDAALLVIDATRTTAAEVRACEKIMDGQIPILGVVLNRAQDRDLSRYRYGRKG